MTQPDKSDSPPATLRAAAEELLTASGFYLQELAQRNSEAYTRFRRARENLCRVLGPKEGE